jgi:hypothetical protein
MRNYLYAMKQDLSHDTSGSTNLISGTDTLDFASSYSSDLAKGEIKSNAVGWRMFMLSSNGWVALRNELYKKFSSGAEVILVDMGRSYGSTVVAELQKQKGGKYQESLSDHRPDPRIFSRLATASGWGRVSLSGDLDGGKHFSVTVANCVFCGREESFSHGCPFLRGVSLGIASSLFRGEYSVLETCSVDKNQQHLCKFEIERK